MQEYVRIDGMTCQSCVRNIEGTIKKLNGIQSIKVSLLFFFLQQQNGIFEVSLDEKLGTINYDPNEIHINDVIRQINEMGFTAQLNHTIVDVELGGISDENIPIAIERISSIPGVINVDFPLRHDSSHVKITYNKNQIESYTLYQKIQSIGYKVHPKLEKIARAYLRIHGMHCNSCVMNITQTVEDLPGIHNVKVSFDDQSANILYDPDVIDLTIIIKEIENLDFQVAMAPTKDTEETSLARATTSTGMRTVDRREYDKERFFS